MGRITNVIFCENAIIDTSKGDTKINCNGVMARGAVPAVPSLYTLSLLVIVDIAGLDTEIDSIRIVIKAPDNTTIFDQSLGGDQMPADSADKKDLNIAMNIQNLLIRIPGKYTFEFSFNGSVDFTKEFEIDKREMI